MAGARSRRCYASTIAPQHDASRTGSRIALDPPTHVWISSQSRPFLAIPTRTIMLRHQSQTGSPVAGSHSTAALPTGTREHEGDVSDRALIRLRCLGLGPLFRAVVGPIRTRAPR